MNLRRWQFDVLFIVALAGFGFALAAPIFGIEVNATAASGFGIMLTFVLTQRKEITKSDPPEPPP